MPNRGRAILYTLVVFLAGGLTGAVLTNLYEHFMRHPAGHVITPASWLKADRAHYIEKLRADLELTDTQTKDLEKILDETMRQYHDLHAFSHHIRQEGILRIRGILDEPQRKKFDKYTRAAAEGALEQSAPASATR